jgi:iron-sulfur cluster assembly protein
VINITDSAKKQLVKILKENKKEYIRLAVVGGGCSGLSYKIDFGELKEKDYVLDMDKYKILIDPKSGIYLKDSVLEFQEGLNGKGFVFKNPNATNSCGCGESFSI